MFIYKFKSKPLLKFHQEDEKFIIYKHTSPSGKCYVGQTSKDIESRWKGHIKDSKKDNPKYKFHKAIKKYGEENFNHEVLEELQTELFCNASEIYWIDKFQSANRNFGYNLTFGGEGGRKTEEMKQNLSESLKGQIPWNKGKQLPLETKLKISKTTKIICSTLEVRRRNSDAQKAAQNKPEVRKHNSITHMGKKHTEESKIKMRNIQNSPDVKQRNRESHLGEKNPNFGKKQSPKTIAKRLETRRKNKELKLQELKNVQTLGQNDKLSHEPNEP